MFNKLCQPLLAIFFQIIILPFESVYGSSLIFSEEFNNSAEDSVLWRHYQAGPKFDGVNSEAAVSVENGVLAISAFKNQGQNITGSISFRSAFSIQKGYLEIRTRFPKLRKGMQCSISLKSPKFGNNSIDKNLSPEKTGSIITLAQSASSRKGVVTTDIVWGNWSDKKKVLRSQVPYNLHDGEFHTFGLELNNNHYNFYLNGKQYWKVEEGVSGVPLYLVANCEIKSSLGDFKDESLSSSFEIDYVRYLDEYKPEPKIPSGTIVEARDWDIRNGKENIEIGDFSDDPEFVPSQPGDFDAIRIVLREGSHLGTDAVFDLPFGTKEVWIQYCLMFADSWQAKTSGKLPGFSADSGKWFGGQGGHPSNGDNAWSARMMYGEYEANTRTVPIGQYVYHTDQGKVSEYGDPEWWSLTEQRLISDSARLKSNHWVSIKQHLKVNAADENDGLIETWLDGELAYRRADFNFTNAWLHRRVTRFWLDVYLGGGPVSLSEQKLFIDQVNYSLGSQDSTSANCQ